MIGMNTPSTDDETTDTRPVSLPLASCCTTKAQATCCEPSEKAACCGEPASKGCGCQ